MNYTKTLSLLSFLLLFNSCGENTTTPVTTDIQDMNIIAPITTSTLNGVYSTDITTMYARVDYMDGTSADTNDLLSWSVSDNTMVYLSNEITLQPLANEGNFTLRNGFNEFEYFDNSLVIKIIGITDINGTNKTWDIINLDTNTTGTHSLVAKGYFTDDNTSKKNITHNIVWTSAGATATFTTDDNYNVTIDITGTGDINITATLFADVNASITKTYNINQL